MSISFGNTMDYFYHIIYIKGNIYRQVVEFQKEVCAIRSQQNTLEIDRNRFGMKHIKQFGYIYIYIPRQGSEGNNIINKIK